MRVRLFISFLLILGVFIAVAGCVGTDSSLDDDKLVVAVSIVPEETFVKEVAGDNAEVIVMIPPGYSPETYDLTPKQMQKLAGADIYFAIGVPSESAILPSLNPDTRCVCLQDAVAAVYPDLEMDGARDPHIWLSPRRAEVMVDTIASVLSSYDAGHSAEYQKNADAYKEKIAEASRDAAELLKNAAGRTFIATHPAYAYFADEYGLKMLSLEKDGKEATIQHMQDLLDVAKAGHISTIFYQQEAEMAQANAFAEEIGGSTALLSPLASDYTENIRSMAAAIAAGVA
ncbi:MAG TPA: zinc ABC transporter substrate-binding protein [Methanocorpusculum sp.]|nr:zinc ABC transporter substrate-binding protein [Methanocorpusculum sp.]